MERIRDGLGPSTSIDARRRRADGQPAVFCCVRPFVLTSRGGPPRRGPLLRYAPGGRWGVAPHDSMRFLSTDTTPGRFWTTDVWALSSWFCSRSHGFSPCARLYRCQRPSTSTASVPPCTYFSALRDGVGRPPRPRHTQTAAAYQPRRCGATCGCACHAFDHC